MKTLQIFFLSLCLCVLPIAVPVTFTGCAAQPVTSTQTSTQIVLDAEKALQSARLTFDTFVTLERQNEAALKLIDPQIHTFANTIRANGLNWVDSLSGAIKTFQGAETPQNQANLNTWLTTVNNAVLQANTYIAQAKALK